MILLFDIDPAVRDALQFSLRSEGFQVRDYQDGADLLHDAMQERARCLLIGDTPPASDGLRLAEHLYRRGVVTPVVLLAGRATPELRQRAAACRVRCVLEKPLLDDSLALLLSRLGQQSVSPGGGGT